MSTLPVSATTTLTPARYPIGNVASEVLQLFDIITRTTREAQGAMEKLKEQVDYRVAAITTKGAITPEELEPFGKEQRRINALHTAIFGMTELYYKGAQFCDPRNIEQPQLEFLSRLPSTPNPTILNRITAARVIHAKLMENQQELATQRAAFRVLLASTNKKVDGLSSTFAGFLHEAGKLLAWPQPDPKALPSTAELIQRLATLNLPGIPTFEEPIWESFDKAPESIAAPMELEEAIQLMTSLPRETTSAAGAGTSTEASDDGFDLTDATSATDTGATAATSVVLEAVRGPAATGTAVTSGASGTSSSSAAGASAPSEGAAASASDGAGTEATTSASVTPTLSPTSSSERRPPIARSAGAESVAATPSAGVALPSARESMQMRAASASAAPGSSSASGASWPTGAPGAMALGGRAPTRSVSVRRV